MPRRRKRARASGRGPEHRILPGGRGRPGPPPDSGTVRLRDGIPEVTTGTNANMAGRGTPIVSTTSGSRGKPNPALSGNRVPPGINRIPPKPQVIPIGQRPPERTGGPAPSGSRPDRPNGGLLGPPTKVTTRTPSASGRAMKSSPARSSGTGFGVDMPVRDYATRKPRRP